MSLRTSSSLNRAPTLLVSGVPQKQGDSLGRTGYRLHMASTCYATAFSMPQLQWDSNTTTCPFYGSPLRPTLLMLSLCITTEDGMAACCRSNFRTAVLGAYYLTHRFGTAKAKGKFSQLLLKSVPQLMTPRPMISKLLSPDSLCSYALKRRLVTVMQLSVYEPQFVPYGQVHGIPIDRKMRMKMTSSIRHILSRLWDKHIWIGFAPQRKLASISPDPAFRRNKVDM